jgi:hypothetical protein
MRSVECGMRSEQPQTEFVKLSNGWNAQPNAPEPVVSVVGDDVLLRFYMNSYAYSGYQEGDVGVIRFVGCWRYRLGGMNDEGWYRGQCRFSRIAPQWGEFYEVKGNLLIEQCPDDWVKACVSGNRAYRHFLFYFRDNTFECDSLDWEMSVHKNKAVDSGT